MFLLTQMQPVSPRKGLYLVPAATPRVEGSSGGSAQAACRQGSSRDPAGVLHAQRAWRVGLLMVKAITEGSFPWGCTNQPDKLTASHEGSTDEGGEDKA